MRPEEVGTLRIKSTACLLVKGLLKSAILSLCTLISVRISLASYVFSLVLMSSYESSLSKYGLFKAVELPPLE